MVLSILVAGLGILLSWLFYHRRSLSAESVATTFRPLYNLFWHKYYFDEFYDGVLVALTVYKARLFAQFDGIIVDGIVNGVGKVTRDFLAVFIGAFDNRVVDGMVNRVAQVTWAVGGRVRRIQTGAIQTYLFRCAGWNCGTNLNFSGVVAEIFNKAALDGTRRIPTRCYYR